MPQRIQAPDGSIVEFPDDMTDSQISLVMQKHYGRNPRAGTKSEALGFAKGILPSLENMDMVTALADRANPVASVVRQFAPGLDPHETVAPSLRGLRRGVETEMAQGVKPGLAGEVGGNLVGTAPVMPLGALGKGGAIVTGMLQGGLSSEGPRKGNVGQTLTDMGLNAGFNWAGGKATDALADTIAPVVDPAVEVLRKWGVDLTPGQIKGGKAMVREDRMMSRPVVGERIAADRAKGLEQFNRGAINRALFPLGLKLPENIATGRDAVAWMQEQAGGAYDKILPGLKLQADPRLAAGLRKAWSAAQDLAPQDQERFLQIVQNKLRFDDTGALSGRKLTVALRDLRDLAAGFSRGMDEDKRILGDALGDVHEGLMSAVMSQNPGAAKALKAANEAYKGNLVVNRAAAAADDGVASTGQLKTAMKAVDRSKNKTATAAGRAPMQDYVDAGRRVLPSKTPDSGTAGRLMDAKLGPKIGGSLDALAYEIDKAIQKSPLGAASRPDVARQVAGLLKKYRTPASVAAGPVLGGLLAGLLPNE